MSVSLIYIPSDRIVRYVSQNPIEWHQKYAHMARRGGVGDRVGVSPTPMVYEFLNLYRERMGLFTQADFRQWCFAQWKEWVGGFTRDETVGFSVRLYRNVYPSMIDSLHVWALLCETGRFDACVLDSTLDATGKSDISVIRGDDTYRIALYAGSTQSISDRRYKVVYRSGNASIQTIEVPLPMDRPQYPGNKRWYKIEDFSSVLECPVYG